MLKLSICITVYNQIELLKKNIQNLLQYQGDDIQIVVSDNCSQDPIADMLASFADPRIKYCRTERNVGHDGNILNVFRNCDTPYAFLLRTKDTLLPEEIPTVIETVHAHPDVGYWRFASVNLRGHAHGMRPTKIYAQGAEAAKGSEKIDVHPSGEVYNLRFLTEEDYQFLSSCMEQRFSNHLGFIVHSLLRMLLLARSNIAFCGEHVWVWNGGAESREGTVNVSKNRKSIYAPEYQYSRWECEMDFISTCLPAELHRSLHQLSLRSTCRAVTTDYQRINQSKGMQECYQCEEQAWSIDEEKKIFLEKLQEIISAYPPEEQAALRKEARRCLGGLNQFYWRIQPMAHLLFTVKFLGLVSDLRKKLLGRKRETL